MRYPEGHKIHYSLEFQAFTDTHKLIREIEPENKFVYFGDLKTEQGCYQAVNISDKRIVAYRLTPKGRVSKYKRYFWLHEYFFSCVYEFKGKQTLDHFERIKNRNKNYVCKGKYRDTQRLKVYRAEQEMRIYLRDIGKQYVFESNEKAQQYIDYLRESTFKYSTKLKNVKPVTIRHNPRMSSGDAHALFHNGLIEYGDPNFGLNIVVVLHEVTHIFHDTNPSHGIEFTSAFLYVLKLELPLAYKKLIEKYDKHKVKYEIW